MKRSPVGARTCADELPEGRRAGRIGNEVHALFVAAVVDAVAAPVVEEPGLAGGHVHSLVAAMEADFLAREDRDVHAHAVEPVIAGVRMLRHLAPAAARRISRERLQTTPKLASTCRMYGDARKCGVGRIGPRRFVVLRAVDADQPQRRVAFA